MAARFAAILTVIELTARIYFCLEFSDNKIFMLENNLTLDNPPRWIGELTADIWTDRKHNSDCLMESSHSIHCWFSAAIPRLCNVRSFLA